MATKKLTLQRFLPYRLSVLTNRISERLANAYTQQFGITIPQWRVMAVLGERDVPLSATEIAQVTAQDKVVVSRSVRGLVNERLIKRRASQEDGRVSYLALTARGRKVYAAIAAVAANYEAQLLAELTREERAGLDATLDKLARRVGALDANGRD